MQMMQRWCSKLRLLAPLHSTPKPHHHRHSFISNLLLHTSPNLLHKPYIFSQSLISPNFKPLFNPHPLPHICHSPISFANWGHLENGLTDITLFPLLKENLTQVRYITAKQRKSKLKCRRPMPPVVSKVKKIKIKGYSSFKGRFRLMNDGQIRRWKAGKRHNAHSKSKISKRRLRQPGVVHPAYAKVLKKLNFGA
ncbi:hypothetical protein CASFOL_036713 [Castilleja foliolosa]|uniref:50S ribosomal protein L35 n=1 Tax=Castilleja foliolosa TaxID=1961234 RepID=A0ABD3BPJ7_9LAMI